MFVLFIAALSAAVFLGHLLDQPWLIEADAAASRFMQRHASESLTAFMLAISLMHNTVAVWVASFALCGWFAWRRNARWFVLTLLVLPGGTVLNWCLKHVFQRARPTGGDYVHLLHSYSFPSGHTIFATLLYGLIALWLMTTRVRGQAARIAVVCIALACIATVACSRVYLGVHYLSDVSTAFGVGTCWLGLCGTGMLGGETHRRA